MKQVALFFGSFNPVHKGHIALAESVLEQKMAEEVWFVLSPRNPFKEESDLWSETERASRLQRALEGRAGLRFCDVELSLPKPSYTVQTLRCLWQKYPDCRFSILMGEDNLVKLHLWREYREILRACDIYVYPRAGEAREPGEVATNCKASAATHETQATAEAAVSPALTEIEKEFPERIHKIKAPLLPVSSTQIRGMLQRGLDVSGLLP